MIQYIANESSSELNPIPQDVNNDVTCFMYVRALPKNILFWNQSLIGKMK